MGRGLLFDEITLKGLAMANFSWSMERAITVDEIFRRYNLSPMKKFYTFGEYVERYFKEYGFKII